MEGFLSSLDNGLFIISLDQNEVEIEEGGSAVLYFPETERERALTVITQYHSPQIHCQEGEHISPDKRAFPRLFAGIKVLYQSVATESALSWYDGGKELAEPWHSTDEYMNFSVTGLAFDGTGMCSEDELLALRISVGGETQEWRALAKPVRVQALKDYEQEDLENGQRTVCNVAVFFESVPDDCAQALADLTNRVLDRS